MNKIEFEKEADRLCKAAERLIESEQLGYDTAIFLNNEAKKLEIIKFFVERLKIYLKESENVRIDIANVITQQYLSNLDSHKLVDILYLTKKAKFLNDFLQNPQYKNLLLLYKRSANILAIVVKEEISI